MDNRSLKQSVNKVSILKYKYLGSFPPKHSFDLESMPNESFQIVNTTNAQNGEHWVSLIRHQNEYYFGDSLGRPIEMYPELWKFHGKIPYGRNQVITSPIQSTPDLCGFFAIYITYLIFRNLPLIDCSEKNLLRFVNKYNIL